MSKGKSMAEGESDIIIVHVNGIAAEGLLTLQAHRSWRVIDLKWRLWQESGHPVAAQKLVADAAPLVDTQTLDCVCSGTDLSLTLVICRLKVEQDKLCAICLHAPPDCVHVPCGHQCVCISCADAWAALKVNEDDLGVRCPECSLPQLSEFYVRWRAVPIGELLEMRKYFHGSE
eukprot:gnl/TRDRNA2_/TRDRNA2_46269_c0_seq1.p1 gnl/TRDRNA2_/TRDRNA2_46269_c0~~gnl/TRDRNA2_/TRDRNA2_46269_c0_seq1.p1  ORF type:complete len:174 (+),score=22.94 gnl/TRDRNA2_/TRDRNA2_46269_c0_seq1:15-536(+)